ncbi:recombinase family protein [Bacillus pumilus]|uniref:recombinase family protein n=1 Tax=Bacillus TaxID=1386 RepID=UPI00203C5538|nr:recombinase family protein [Bacillus safensis]MCM3137351.1 recombinase family protein [Bacillus safensis]
MLKMISVINDFERENMLERQREGIAIAKAEGKYKGRKEVSIPDFGQHYKRYMQKYRRLSLLKNWIYQDQH